MLFYGKDNGLLLSTFIDKNVKMQDHTGIAQPAFEMEKPMRNVCMEYEIDFIYLPSCSKASVIVVLSQTELGPQYCIGPGYI